MSRSWDNRRAQVEPIAALVALLAIGVGLGLYAGVLAQMGPGGVPDRAAPTLDRVHAEVVAAGVAEPSRLEAGRGAGPDGYRVAVQLSTAEREWRAGPRSPPSADVAERRVSVRVGPGDVRSGTLRAEVWS